MGRCRNQTEFFELIGSMNSAKLDLQDVDKYMEKVSVDISLLITPASAYVKYEPMGVCLIYGAWNYPLILTFKPII